MSLARKSFSLFKRDIFLFVTGTFTSVLIARKLGPDVMGVWVVISLISIYAETFGRLKFDIASVYFLGKGLYAEKEVERTLNSVAIIISLLIGIPCFIFSEILCKFLFNGSIENLVYLRITIFQIPFNFLYSNYTYLLIYKENTRVYNTMTIIKALVGSIGSLILIYIFKLGLFSVIIMTLAAVLVSFFYGFFNFSTKDVKKYSLLNFSMIRVFSTYAFKMYLAGIVGNLNSYVLRTLLSKVLISSKLAFFSIAQDRVTFLNKIPEAINMLFFSRISKAVASEERNDITAKAFRIVLISSLLSGIFAIIFIKPLVWFLYGASYLPVVTPFIILVPGVIAFGCITLLIQFFNAINKPNIQLIIYSLIFILQILFVVLFWKNLTIVVASFSFTVSMILALVFSLFLFLNYSKLGISDIYFQKNDFSYLYNFVKMNFIKISFFKRKDS